MSRGPRDRPSAAEKKEGQGCTGPVDCGKAAPASSADLVNCPQGFPLGFRRRYSVLSFNVRTSLFVGPRLFVVLPQGVQGTPLRRHAQLPASHPCARKWSNFLDGSFLTGCWTNGSMAGNPGNAPSVRSTWLSR